MRGVSLGRASEKAADPHDPPKGRRTKIPTVPRSVGNCGGLFAAVRLFQQCFEVGDVAEVADDDVGVGFGGQHLAGVRGRQRDDAARAAGPPCRLDARLGVFEDDAFYSAGASPKCGRRRQVEISGSGLQRVTMSPLSPLILASKRIRCRTSQARNRHWPCTPTNLRRSVCPHREFVEQGDQSRHGFDFGSVDSR